MFEVWSLKLGKAWNLKLQTWNLKPETSNLKPETSNLKPETSNLKFNEKKEWERQLRKATSQVTGVEERIARIEREMETTAHLLAAPEHLDTDEIEKMSTHYQQLQIALNEAMTQWEQLTAELEVMKKTWQKVIVKYC